MRFLKFFPPALIFYRAEPLQPERTKFSLLREVQDVSYPSRLLFQILMFIEYQVVSATAPCNIGSKRADPGQDRWSFKPKHSPDLPVKNRENEELFRFFQNTHQLRSCNRPKDTNSIMMCDLDCGLQFRRRLALLVSTSSGGTPLPVVSWIYQPVDFKEIFPTKLLTKLLHTNAVIVSSI